MQKLEIPAEDLAWLKQQLEEVGGFRFEKVELQPNAFGVQVRLHARQFYQPYGITRDIPAKAFKDGIDWRNRLDPMVEQAHAIGVYSAVPGHHHLDEYDELFRSIDLALNKAAFPAQPEICAVDDIARDFAVAVVAGQKPNAQAAWFMLPKTGMVLNPERTIAAFLAEVERWLFDWGMQLSLTEVQNLIKQTEKQP